MSKQKTSTQKIRLDIQAMRALAVGLVLLFHIWPNLVPGGYIGVDVFFVISGYLITGLLIRELDRHGRVRMGQFYLRRAARLLPASLLVLASILVATFLLQPEMFWADTAREVASATLYVENWYLHFRSMDYLAGDSAASPVQHFWSLGVEEQFYLIWPWAMLLGAGLFGFNINKKSKDSESSPSQAHFLSGVRLMLGLVVVASFVYGASLVFWGESGLHYFSTFTRAWQLGLGGLLACWRGPGLGPWAWPLGAFSILASALVLTADSAYPGWLALWPTLSAALMLAGGQRYNQDDLRIWLGGRPVQFVGDISYSLYLWHWPLVVFANLLWPGNRGFYDGMALVLASLLLAAGTKYWIEDRFRLGHARSPTNAGAFSGVATASVLILLGSFWLPLADRNLQQNAAASTFENNRFPGAAVLDGAYFDPERRDFIPSIAEAKSDNPTAYSKKCHQNQKDIAPLRCIYGSDDASTKILIIGDSHAVNYHPTFHELTKFYDLQLISITKSSCAFSFVITSKEKQNYESCLSWSHELTKSLSDLNIDLILVAQTTGHGLGKGVKLTEKTPQQQVAKGMADAWLEAERVTGATVVPIHPTIFQPTLVPECAAKHEWPFSECTRGLKGQFTNRPIILAAERLNKPMIDLVPYFCPDEICPAVIGGVFVYRDRHHITATYAKTLAPMMAKKLEQHGFKLKPR